jgi:hypothetical protein
MPVFRMAHPRMSALWLPRWEQAAAAKLQDAALAELSPPRGPDGTNACAWGPRGSRSCIQMTRGPSGSYAGFAPTCSTRRFHLAAEEIEARAILRGVGFGQKCCAATDPLGGVHEALEHGVLHPLTSILAQARYPAKAPGACAQSCTRSQSSACVCLVCTRPDTAPGGTRRHPPVR